MTAACCHPLPLYRPRDPQASDLWRLMDRHFDTFQRVYDERFQAKYGYWRPIIERSVRAFLRCGDLHEGFARVRCPDCGGGLSQFSRRTGYSLLDNGCSPRKWDCPLRVALRGLLV